IQSFLIPNVNKMESIRAFKSFGIESLLTMFFEEKEDVSFLELFSVLPVFLYFRANNNITAANNTIPVVNLIPNDLKYFDSLVFCNYIAEFSNYYYKI